MPPASEQAPPLALLFQYGRFGVVGLVATLVHVLVYSGLIELLATAPLAANTLGFVAGVQVSFLGHRGWTFREPKTAEVARSLTRFWVVALLGFALNTGFVGLVTGVLRLGYGWAIPPMVGVTPLVTFALAKLWAFRAGA
jgi:putative flippase GtrA